MLSNSEAALLLTQLSKITPKDFQQVPNESKQDLEEAGEPPITPCPMSPASVPSQTATVISDITDDGWEVTKEAAPSEEAPRARAVSVASQESKSSVSSVHTPLVFPGVHVSIPNQVVLQPVTPISVSAESCRHWNWSPKTNHSPISVVSTVPRKIPIPTPIRATIRKKFSWKKFPELEAFLVANREEYLKHSALNYTSQQKRFNNHLTKRLLGLAEIHGYVFENFSFVMVRDRIRCYYKSYVQALKKRGIICGYSARKAGTV